MTQRLVLDVVADDELAGTTPGELEPATEARADKAVPVDDTPGDVTPTAPADG